MKTKKNTIFIFTIIAALLFFQSLVVHSNPVHAQGESTPPETGLPTEIPTATADPTATMATPPSLTFISPSEAIFGQGDLILTLDGSGFLPESIVFWNGTNALETVFINETQLTATFPASAFTQSGVLKIAVNNPNSNFSNEVNFTVKCSAPELSGISPDYALAGDAGFNILLSGNNFCPDAQTYWNGIQLSTTFISANQLQVAVPGTYVNNVGKAFIKVINLAVGEISGELVFEIYPRTDTWLAQSPEGGDIMDIAIDPNNPVVMYVATRNAGLFKSNDNGERWYQTNNGIDTSEVWSITVNPANSSMLIATGRNGIYLSKDGGAFWTKVIQIGVGGSDVVKFHPKDPNLIFVATYAALYRSTDEGTTWTDITGTKLGGTPDWMEELVQVSVDALDPNNVYVVESHNPLNQIWKTTDNGQTWSQITEETNGLPSPRSIYADPFKSEVLYSGTSSGIYKSEDGGITWRQLNSWIPWSITFLDNVPDHLVALNFNGINKTSDGGETWELSGLEPSSYFITMGIDPNNSDVIYAGSYAGVSKSQDGGHTWELKNKGLYALETNGLVYAPQTQSLYATTGMGGMWKSTDLGQNWHKIIEGASNSVSLDPNDPDHLLVNANNETFDGGLTWSPRGFASGIRQVIFAANSDLYGGDFNSATTELKIFKSTDNGVTWTQKNNGLPACDSDTCWISFISTDPSDSNTVYAGLGASLYHPEENWNEYFGSLYKTLDGGDHWFKILGGITYYSQSLYYHSLTVDPSNSSILYMGTNWGMYKSIDDGLTWNLSTTGGDFSKYGMPINAIAVDPVNGDVVYVGTEGYGVYRSLNGGATWNKFNYGLPSSRVYALIAIPPIPGSVSSSSLDITSLNSSNIQLSPRVYTAAGGTVYGYFSVNYAPTGINLSASSVAGKLPVGSLVGNISVLDKNTDDVFMHTLVSGEGDADNASFIISGNKLLTADVFDQTVKSSYFIRVRVTDLGGMKFERSFQVTVGANSKAPLLVSPINGQTLLYNLPLFDWNDVSGATNYVVQVSRNTAFSLLVVNTKTVPSQFVPTAALLTGQTLYWRVQANTSSGASGWSETRSFITAAPPSVPVLALPLNNSLSISYQPKLDWSTATVPVGKSFDHYQVQASTDTLFNTLVVDQNVSGLSSSQLTLGTALLPNTKYYWRVRSFNTRGQYSAWSATWSFRTVMVQPKLTTPIDGSTVLVLRPLLDWEDVPGATGYSIQVSKNDLFTQLVGTFTVARATSYYTPVSNLPVNLKLFWRVRANGLNGPSLYSGYQWIKTGNPPSVPVLVTPALNVLVTDYTPLLDWKPATIPVGAPALDHYEVVIDDSADYGSPWYSGSIGTDQYTPETNLTPNTKYYWRVRAVNLNGDMSDWSVGRYFRTSIVSPIVTAPIGGEVTSTLRPQFDWEDVPGATGYTIQVCKTNAFTLILTTYNIATATSLYAPIADLPANIPLYWRVKANGLNGPSLWSTVGSFQSPNPASTPNVVSPNNINIDTLQPKLTWSASLNSPIDYQVQVSRNNLFTTTVSDSQTPTTYLDVTSLLDDLTTYYWRVRSVNAQSQYSNWSKVAWFKTPGKISGQVLDSVTSQGIPDVRVQIVGKNITTKTDGHGNYVLPGLKPGAYAVSASKTGFLFSPLSVKVTISSINLVANFTAKEPQTVSGYVMLDPRINIARSMSLAQAERITATSANGLTITDNRGNTVKTGTDGSFTIQNVLPGDYNLKLVTTTSQISYPATRNFSLGSDAFAQYFMLTPTLPAATKLLKPDVSAQSVFSENGRFLVIAGSIGLDGRVIDLFTGEETSGVGLQPDISGDGRYVVFYAWDAITPDDTNGKPDVYGFDRINNTYWRISVLDDINLYNPQYRSPGLPHISADGNWVVFTAPPARYNMEDPYNEEGSCGSVFIHNIALGQTTCLPFLKTSASGISPNGQFIAFETWESLMDGDTNKSQDVYLYNRDADGNQILDEENRTVLERLSVTSDGGQAYGSAIHADISADGRYAIFSSTNFSPLEDPEGDSFVYLRDRVSKQTIPVFGAVTINNCKIMWNNPMGSITPDGRFVLFTAATFSPYCNNNENYFLGHYLYLYDRDLDQDGIFDEPGATLFKKVDTPLQLTGTPYSENPSISADGRFIIFTDRINDRNGLYIHDRGTSPQSFSISGRVTDWNGRPISDVKIDAAGGWVAYSDVNGYYALPGLPGGTYYLTPSKDDFTFSPGLRAATVPPNSSGQDFKLNLNYHNDFSNDTLAQSPNGWSLEGAQSVVPVIQESGGVGLNYQSLSFPAAGDGIAEQWLLRTKMDVADSYQASTKLTFLDADSGSAGLVLGWDAVSGDHIDILLDAVNDEIVFEVTDTSTSPAVPSISNTGSIPSITPNTPYWIRAIAEYTSSQNARIRVYFSVDGTNFDEVMLVTGLKNISGIAGLSVGSGPRSSVLFDDFAMERYRLSAFVDGRVITPQNQPVPNVVIQNGSGGSVTTDNFGYYLFNSLNNGLYTLTPGLANYVFAPEQMPVTVKGEDIANMNFAAVKVVTVSGRVTLSGKGMSDATITNEYGDRVTTDANGNYSLNVLANNGYNFQVSKLGYKFTPNVKYVYAGQNTTGINFTAAPQGVGLYKVSGVFRMAKNIDIENKIAYLAGWGTGLRIIDLSDLTNPVEMGFFDVISSGTGVYDVDVVGNYAYLANYPNGLLVLDISDPTHPVQVAHNIDYLYTWEVEVLGNYAYVQEQNGIRVFDITNPAAPSVAGGYNLGLGNGWQLLVDGQKLFVLTGSSVIQFDISNPSSPQWVRSYSPGPSLNVKSFAVSADKLYEYVNDGSLGLVRDLKVFDLSTAELVGSYKLPFSDGCYGATYSNKTVYLACGTKGIRAIDVSKPTLPFEKGYFVEPGFSLTSFVFGDYLFVGQNRRSVILHHP